MTDDQQTMINKKDEDGLRKCISLLMASKHTDRDELISYCEGRLSRLNRADAMIEMGECDDLEGLSR